jgi:cell division septal protein FtsQ
MLFFICLILGVAAVIGAVVIDRNCGWKWDWASVTLAVIGVCLLIVAVILGVFWIVTVTSSDASYAANVELYESLVYQAEHNVYDNDNDIGKAELIAKITDWNCDLAAGRIKQDKWVSGFLHYQWYDEFEFIPLDLIA